MQRYVFRFSARGQAPFTREFDCRDDGVAIELGRIAVVHQVAVRGTKRAAVLVARAASPDDEPLGVWACTDRAKPVWSDAASEGRSATGEGPFSSRNAAAPPFASPA
jgi:hypothetical protein